MIYFDPTTLENGSVIGDRGTHSERDSDGRVSMRPHEFGVEIGDTAHVGPLCTIQRGTWRHTKVGPRCILGPQVNVGHNTEIGADCWIAAGALIAGSCTVGDGVTIWMGAMIGHKVTVGNGAEIGMGAVVLRDVPPGETWAGNPAGRIR